MNFDVVIGNPPYQESDGGSNASARPVYNLFVEFAINQLKSQKVCLITPSKWFAGGKGLDDFRQFMINNRHLKVLSDYVNSKELFSGVSIGGGVSYFLYDREYEGDCKVINHYDGVVDTSQRPLNEFPVFVRYNRAVSLLHKVLDKSSKSVSGFVSPRNPFGLSSNQRGKDKKFDDSVLLLTSAGEFYIEKSKVNVGVNMLDEYKVVISKVTSEHAGEPDKGGFFKIISSNRIMPPNSVCTDSYLVLFSTKSKVQASNYFKYMKTKFYRALLMLSVTSINLSAKKFQFIPQQNFKNDVQIDWSASIPEIDRQLYKKYGLSASEIEFVEKKIKTLD